MSSATGTTKYWTGTERMLPDGTFSEWVLADGTVTTAPGADDIGILGGGVSGLSLAQSGTVTFFGLTAADIGTLDVDGIGPWTIEGTGGTHSKITSLNVAMGATVTVFSTLAVKNVVISQVQAGTTPATVTLNDGLPPAAVIDGANQTITASSSYSGSYTNVAISTASGTLANISLAGTVQFAGAPTSDGNSGTQLVVDGTQPTIGGGVDFILDLGGANDIGRSTGETVQIGDTNVNPNGDQGTGLYATATNGTVVQVPFDGTAVVPNIFAQRLTYYPTNSAYAYELSPWTLTFTNGTSTLTATTASLVGVTPPPLASNIAVSGNSAYPTFTWSYPSGTINGLFFDIYDDKAKNVAGGTQAVFEHTITENTGTYTVQPALDGGLTLIQGRHYTVDLYAVALRNPSGPLDDANSQAWSESYFDFVPGSGTIPQAVYLPAITSSGAYQFHDTGIVAGQQIFIDPAIATGYTYATAPGDPNFASVLLPAIQTDPYTVSFLDNGVKETDSVAPSAVFDFPTGGVSTFTVTGIDPADNLDPANATAFVTGLTFVSAGNFDGTQTPIVQTLCFCAGTLIATSSGEVPVERLATGDQVLTIRGEARPVTWIGIGQVLATRGRRTAATPVIVRKGALADNVPHQDLRVTKGHAFYLDDVLIPVEFLVNHRSILWDDRAQEVTLYHIELDRHDVLIANGAPAESYRDDGNRWLFQNANAGWNLPPQEPCAPVLTGGPLVDAVWRRLLDRSGPRPGVTLTDDPELHLIVDGKRTNATLLHSASHIFHLTRRPTTVRIVSRAGVPQELGIARDPRPLGVALQRIAVRQGTRFRVMQAADPTLTEGFHAFEPDAALRWTDGDAALPMPLFEGFEGQIELVLHVAGTTQYPLFDEPERTRAA